MDWGIIVGVIIVGVIIAMINYFKTKEGQNVLSF